MLALRRRRARGAGGRPARLPDGLGPPAAGPDRGPRATLLARIPAGNAEGTTRRSARRSLLYVARITANGRVVLVRLARLAFAEWRPFLVSLGLAATRRGAGGRRALDAAGPPADATDRRAGRGHPARGGGRARRRGARPRRGRAGRSGTRPSTRCRASSGRARATQRRFLESVSHELRTPLTAIRGLGRRLAGGGGAVRRGRAGDRRRGRPAGAAGRRPRGPGPVRARGLRGQPRTASICAGDRGDGGAAPRPAGRRSSASP